LKQYDAFTRAKMQCRICGVGVGQNIPMAGVTEAWDDVLEARSKAEYESAYTSYRQQQSDAMSEKFGQRSSAWWSQYSAYLRTAIWQTKRQLVLDRAGGVCEACGQAQAQQVHHLRYPETFGLEPLWDLRAVCIPCHKIIHPHMD
jgi:5-methylcytosine-specific restriction endonuclease McrA